MSPVEAGAERSIERAAPGASPPRTERRGAPLSLLFTLSVVVGTVVAIYALLPARDDVVSAEAARLHRAPPGRWDLEHPRPDQLRAWSIGVVGTGAPLPAARAIVIGARRIDVLDRAAVLIRLLVGADPVSIVVQPARGITPDRVERHDRELRSVAWRRGRFSLVAVGADATAGRWLRALER